MFTDLEMGIHYAAPIEVRLKEMYDAEFGRRGNVHQDLLVLDFGIGPMLLGPELARSLELGVQLLAALLAKAIQLRVIFELCDELVLVGVVFPGGVDDSGDLIVKFGHGPWDESGSGWLKKEIFRVG